MSATPLISKNFGPQQIFSLFELVIEGKSITYVGLEADN
jgi:hypothetical protein